MLLMDIITPANTGYAEKLCNASSMLFAEDSQIYVDRRISVRYNA